MARPVPGDGAPFMQWVMDVWRWTRAGGAATTRSGLGLAHLVSAVEQRL